MSTERIPAAPELNFDTPALRRARQRRMLKDRLTGGVIAVGGIGVILAVLMIFFYLLYEVVPLFQPASVSRWQQDQKTLAPYTTPGAKGKTLYLALDEQAAIGFRVVDNGDMVFFNATDGKILQQTHLALPAGVHLTSFALLSESSRTFAFGLSDGSVRVLRHNYKTSYPNGVQVLTPMLSYPLGKKPIRIGQRPITDLAITGEGEHWAIVSGDGKQLHLTRLDLTDNIFTGAKTLERQDLPLPPLDLQPQQLRLTANQRWLLVAGEDGKIAVVRLDQKPQVTQLQDVSDGQITSFQLLLGGNSLLIGDSQGQLSQWFFVRTPNNRVKLTLIRRFDHPDYPVSQITAEQRRRDFVSVDSRGELGLYNSTARSTVYSKKLFGGAVSKIALAPRGNALLVEHQGQISLWQVDNQHPEISWSVLWDKIWYEGYDKPDYVWQSSAASNDFEPKYSLTPLAFGTLKAAFYALLFAMPLAICGAIYTAYFMSPAMRRKVKPVIELMEALPTVILGFLAGLWLAPIMEANLAGIFICLLIVPLAIVVFGYSWHNLPNPLRYRVPAGWDALLLIPVIILAVWLGILLEHPLEQLLFGGDLRIWLTSHAGISYDQRNAMVVGVAMGFAVIPTIFSITEDALYAVPRSLTDGSLALGATNWQTLTRVVLPTASPGIFSAVMIGMGRAVGETMIVLMATGNTPIMDANIFEGMRTLAANIAIEMPESEVGGTHYRILFLAALALFLFTFVVNTLAELIRQRLRKKYGSL